MNRCIILFIFISRSLPVFSQPADYLTSKKTYAAYQCEQDCEIEIDGLLNESSWLRQEWISDFGDIINRQNNAPFYETKAKIKWDENYIYFGIEVYDSNIWATIKTRDSVLFLENIVEIFLDPNGDTHNYYEIEINALGTLWDLMMTKPYRDGGRGISSWEAKGMKLAIAIDGTLNNGNDTDQKWGIELAIPISEIQSDIKLTRGSHMRMTLTRVQWPISFKDGRYQTETSTPYYWTWAPQKEMTFHEPENWGYLYFIGGNDRLDMFLKNDAKTEYTKYILREVYYSQHSFKKKNGYFTNKRDQLLLNDRITENIQLFTTPSFFEATLKTGEMIWHIDHSGRTWSALKEQP